MRRLILVVAAAGCGGDKGPNADELHAKLAPAIEPKLVVIEKIVKDGLPAPTGKLALAGGPPIEMLRDGGGGKALGNAIYAYEQDLQNIEKLQRNPLRWNFNAELVNHCFMMVRKKMLAGGHYETYSRDPMTWKGDEHRVVSELPQCAALRYLMVVKVDLLKETEYIDKEKFAAGGAAAQVHVYDLEADGKHLGGVEFFALSSDAAHDPSSDLRVNFSRAMEKAIRDHLPDARL